MSIIVTSVMKGKGPPPKKKLIRNDLCVCEYCSTIKFKENTNTVFFILKQMLKCFLTDRWTDRHKLKLQSEQKVQIKKTNRHRW